MPLLSTHIFKKFCSFLRFQVYSHSCVEIWHFLLFFARVLRQKMIWNGLRFFRVAAPSIRFVPWAALASCWPLPQQLLPVSAAGGGRRRCSGKIIYNFAILENLRIFQNCLFTGGVVKENGICSAAFCESAVLRRRTLSGAPAPAPPKGELITLPQTLRLSRKLYRYAKGSPFGRAGKSEGFD